MNLIQPNSVSHNQVQNENSKIEAYSNYIKTIRESSLRTDASSLLDLYRNPFAYNSNSLDDISRKLEKRNIVTHFSFDEIEKNRLNLDYCIFGRKKILTVSHPLFNYKETVYNIVPLISYPEILVSNSMTYDDIVYVSREEIENDAGIARRVLSGKNVNNLLFNGARVNSEMRFCLQKAFRGKENDILTETTRLFEIHELTHKILYNKYKLQDPVTQEEFALSSTIYDNPLLGLAVMYSYLDYDNLTQHKLAALNYIRYIANNSGKSFLMEKPEKFAKEFTPDEIRLLTKSHFDSLCRIFKMNN